MYEAGKDHTDQGMFSVHLRRCDTTDSNVCLSYVVKCLCVSWPQTHVLEITRCSRKAIKKTQELIVPVEEDAEIVVPENVHTCKPVYLI